MTELQRLRDRVDQLQAIIGVDRSTTGRLRDAFGLEIEQAETVGMLYARDFVTRDGLFTVLYGGRPESEWPNDKSLDALMSKLRKRLGEHGITVETKWGEGWFLPPASRSVIRQVIAPNEEDTVERYRQAFGLQPKQARILVMMLERPSVTAVTLQGLVNGYGAARLQIHRMRRRLEPFGITIVGSYGRWSLPEASRLSLETLGNAFLHGAEHARS